MTPPTSFRLPPSTMRQLRALAKRLGMTLTQVLIQAIDRMAREETKIAGQPPVGE